MSPGGFHRLRTLLLGGFAIALFLVAGGTNAFSQKEGYDESVGYYDEEYFYTDAAVYSLFDPEHYEATAIVFDLSNILDQSLLEKNPDPSHIEFQRNVLPNALAKYFSEHPFGSALRAPVAFGESPTYCFTKAAGINFYKLPPVRGKGKVYFKIFDWQTQDDYRLNLLVEICLDGVIGKVRMVFPEDWGPLKPPIRYGDCPEYNLNQVLRKPKENLNFYLCELQPFLDNLLLAASKKGSEND